MVVMSRSLRPLRAPMRRATWSGSGVGQEVERGAELGEAAVVDDGDAVGQAESFVHVVGDEDDGAAGFGVDAAELGLEFGAGDRVEGAEGFVHEEDRGVGGERAGDADALLLTAGEEVGVGVAEAGGRRDGGGRGGR